MVRTLRIRYLISPVRYRIPQLDTADQLSHCLRVINKQSFSFCPPQSPFFDGKVPNWHHFACFFKKKIPTETTQIKNFESLRWDDQQKIKSKMGLIESDVNKLDTTSDSDQMNTSDEVTITIDSFLIQYARTARSKCKKCEARIGKSEIQIRVQNNFSADSSNKWYHLECFGANKLELAFTFNAEE